MSAIFTTKARLVTKSEAWAMNMSKPVGTISSSAPSVQGPDRQLARQTEQAQVEHRNGTDQHHEPHDVQDLDRRIEPQLLAHRRRQHRALDRRQRACACCRIRH
jgi:hypothetical protein